MYVSNEKVKGRKFILYILIIIFVASLSTLTYRIASDIKVKRDEIKKEQQAIKDKIKEELEQAQQEQEERKNEFKKNSFNNQFEFYSGTKWKNAVSMLLDEVITNNKKNTEHLIEVKYNNKSYGTDVNNIKKIKDKMPSDSFINYEVSLDYDKDGYINKVTVERK